MASFSPILKKKTTFTPILSTKSQQQQPNLSMQIGGQTTAQVAGPGHYAQGPAPLGAALLVGAVQAPFKATGSLLASAEQAVTGKPTTFQPNAIQRPFMGSEPISSLQTAASETYAGQRAQGYSPAFSGLTTGLAVFGGTALDLAPFGGPKSTVRMLAATNDVKETAKILRTIGVQNEFVLDYAKLIASMDNTKQIEQTLTNLNQLQSTTKANIVNGVSATAPATLPQKPGAGVWPTTASKQSKADGTSTGSAPTGKEGVSAQKAGTSAPFAGNIPAVVNPPAFRGFKDLTTKLLEDLKGRSTVSKQYILDATNRPDLKQAERDLFRRVLDDMDGTTVDVKSFADRVKGELLPLKVFDNKAAGGYKDSRIYENIVLPDDLRGPIANYDEHIYQSPIKTSAGDVHFSYFRGMPEEPQSYFAHSRIEDTTKDTRRVIEIQSDLFQKGRLELEGKPRDYGSAMEGKFLPAAEQAELKEITRAITRQPDGLTPAQEKRYNELIAKDKPADRAAELAKLEPYRNTWWERVIREELKQAAKDGKTKLQFPTGETAMKIEGLGGSERIAFNFKSADDGYVTPEKLTKDAIGKEVEDVAHQSWIITDVLGDGKFKAIPKHKISKYEEQELANGNLVNDVGNSRDVEEFDISGKVDTANPIYRFYEKDVQKYLTNKLGAKRVKDERGVEWMEVNVSKAMAKAPVEAFGGAAGLQYDEEGNLTFDPVAGAAGALGIGMARKVSKKLEGGTPTGDRPFDARAIPERSLSKSQPPPGSGTPSRPPPGGPPKTPQSSSYDGNVPQGGNAVQKVIQALKEAKPLNKEQAAIYRAERSRRTAAVANMQAKGEAGFHKQLGALKGEMPKVQFDALRKSLKQEDIDELFDMVEANQKILPLEKISAKGALAKIMTGAVPTRSEVELLAEIFPKDFIKAILDKRPLWDKLLEVVGEVLNVPRSLMATMDVSAPLRQGIFFVGRMKQWAPAFGQMFKYLVSEKAYRAMLDDIEARPTYKAMRESKLALMDTANETLTKREEAFMSNLAERIPILGRPIKASGRAYTGFLTKLRADVFDDLVRQSKELNIDDKDLNVAIARYVNSATGRGDLGRFNRAAVILNATFFSPRLMASRLNLLNPIFYANLPPFVRKQALKDLLVFAGLAGSVLSVSKLAGAEVETDPTSADFAKAKFGNTRYDVLGGFQQYIRLANQLIQGRIKSSTTGREITLGEGYKPLTRKDILIRFFESKESPVLSFATALMTGVDTQGREINVPNEVVSRAIPLVVQDIYDIYQDKGLEGLVWWLPAPFGVGSQTYGKVELAEGQNPIGQETAQVRPVPDLSKTIVEKLTGKQDLGSSRNFDVEVYYDQLVAMGPDKAKETLKHIAEVNPELAKQIIQVKKDRDAGITPHDRDLKDMGVKSGDRAMAIIEDLNKLENAEEKKALLKEMQRKGILTEDVWEQVKLLLGKQSKGPGLGTQILGALTGAQVAQADTGEATTDEPNIFEKAIGGIGHVINQAGHAFNQTAAAIDAFEDRLIGDITPTTRAVTTMDDVRKEALARENAETFEVPDRKVRVNKEDLDELRKVLFAEVGSRGPEKTELEARTVTDVALNRLANGFGKAKTLKDVLTARMQFQGYNSKLYKDFERASKTEGGKKRLEAIDKIIAELKAGTLTDSLGGYQFYVHLPDGRIRATKNYDISGL